jgi:hypothetical protein
VGRQPLIGLAADPHRGIVYVTNEFSDSLSVLIRCRSVRVAHSATVPVRLVAPRFPTSHMSLR